MNRCLLAAASLLLTCYGCVGYYRDPYPYGTYSYAPYYYQPYRSPAVYYDPSWMLFYPSFSFGFGYRGYPQLLGLSWVSRPSWVLGLSRLSLPRRRQILIWLSFQQKGH